MSAKTKLVDMAVVARVDKVRGEFDGAGIDALMVSKPVNVRWLTGFTGSNGRVVITTDRLLLITDARYAEQAPQQLAANGVEAEIEITVDTNGAAAAALARDRVGIEAAHLTVAEYGRLEDVLDATLVVTDGLIEVLRQYKDDGEISRLRRASEVADAAFAVVYPLLDERPTERAFGAELDHQMRLLGADEVSFETIVGSGPNAALPHARPSDRRVEHGDLVVLDFGAKIDGYGSDMTRTVVAGGDPTERQAALYDAVATAQRCGVAAVKDGIEQVAIDIACREVLADRGMADHFTHGTGHGIGLEIHEQPILSPRSVGILRAGLVVTVEPGAYFPGYGGVRVEDSVIVTRTGCVPITHSPKGLVPDFVG
ncbi:MAG: Xaa-Pro aminopeptidase [Acidimicrobiales bacterium]|jgi:Xaa-Pro aminopeptidase